MAASKEFVAIVALCFVCFIIFAIFALIAMAGGFKFIDQSESTEPTGQKCCTECVESFGKFFGFVFMVPLAIFIVGISITLYVFGMSNMQTAGRQAFDRFSSSFSQTKSVKERKAAEILFAVGFLVFAITAIILTFASRKGLYSTTDYKNNTPSPATIDDCHKTGGKWCVACKPEFWRLFLASAGAGFGVWIIATGLLYASKRNSNAGKSYF